MTDITDIATRIEVHALANAVKFGGKANPGNVLPKIIGEFPDVKKDIQEVRKQIDTIVIEVNKLTPELQRARLEKLAPELLEKKEKIERIDNLKELEGVDATKGVVMRFAPSPSGPMHIGHAITGGLTSLYVKKYGGKFILRIEDTNSDNIYPPAYEMLPSDGKWIFGNVTDVWIQSDRMPIYYSYVEKLFDHDAVYVCTCTQEAFKEHVEAMDNCPCRNLSNDEQRKRWKKMFDRENGFQEGDCVVRFKADMQHKNPAMRDFPLVRINDSEHPRQGLKYRVWPLMNLCVFVDDVEAGMTHIIRAKDHYDNAKRQEMMYDVLGKPKPYTYFLGRYNFEGLEISCSKTRAKIAEGAFTGWDDPRVPFLCALKRRGYQHEVFLKYTGLTGISPVDKTVSGEEFFKTINAFNKDIIDPRAKRFFFIADNERVEIVGAPLQTLHIRMHPEHDLGTRELHTNNQFLLSKNDLTGLEDGKLYRLLDCVNFTREPGEHGIFTFHSKSLEEFKSASGKKIIHFLPAEGNVHAEVMMPDATVAKGFAEPAVASLKVDDIIQFERFGFCRLDAIENGAHGKVYKFWYTHK